MKRCVKLRAVLIMIILFLLSALALLSVLPRYFDKDTTYTAYIYKDGHLLETISLSEVTEETSHLIGDYEGDYNFIQVTPGAIRISQASCPDQICVNQGWILDSLVPITCLPNHLVIELKADDTVSDTAADAITH